MVKTGAGPSEPAHTPPSGEEVSGAPVQWRRFPVAHLSLRPGRAPVCYGRGRPRARWTVPSERCFACMRATLLPSPLILPAVPLGTCRGYLPGVSVNHRAQRHPPDFGWIRALCNHF